MKKINCDKILIMKEREQCMNWWIPNFNVNIYEMKYRPKLGKLERIVYFVNRITNEGCYFTGIKS